MLDTVFGVPTHAIVVPAVVVLLPLAAFGGVAIALVPALRRRYGVLVTLVTLAGVLSAQLAEPSGEHLFDRQSARFGPADAAEAGLMQRHADLAEQLMPWALVLLLGVALVVLPPLLVPQDVAVPAGAGSGSGPPTGTRIPAGTAGRWSDQAGGAGRHTDWRLPVALVGAAVTLAGAVLTVVLVVRIGNAGSKAAWERLDRPAAAAGCSTRVG